MCGKYRFRYGVGSRRGSRQDRVAVMTDNDGDTNAARDAPRITPCMMAVQNAVSTHDLYRREEAQEAAVTLPFHLPD